MPERSTQTSLVEGEDYYFEGGLLVFTARYHLRRGHCCGSGCRHCPYDAAGEARSPGRKEVSVDEGSVGA